jgi:hypothetical protein
LLEKNAIGFGRGDGKIDWYEITHVDAKAEKNRTFYMIEFKKNNGRPFMRSLYFYPINGGMLKFIFRKLSKGDLTARVYLRRGDLLKSEAHLANQMIDFISAGITEVKAQQNLLLDGIKAMVDNDLDQRGLKGDSAGS